MPKYLHSGRMGDIILSLPTVIAINERLNEKADFYFNGEEDQYLSLKPLLESQPYIQKCELYDGQQIDINLDSFRRMGINHEKGDIARWYFWAWGVTYDLSKPWIHVEPDDRFQDKIIVNRTPRYRNQFDYSFLNRDDVVFVGDTQDYLCSPFLSLELDKYKVPCHKANDLLHLARWLQGNKRLVVCNQSLVWALCTAMGVKAVLEVSPACPNSPAYSPNQREVYQPELFRPTVHYMLGEQYNPPKPDAKCYMLDDPTGCGYYRARLPAKFLNLPIGKHLLDCEAFILHRFINPAWIPEIERLQRQGCTFVWELDDALDIVPDDNPFGREIGERELDAFLWARDQADFILVTTEELKRHLGKPEKTLVAPNLIDLTAFPDPEPREQTTVLWAGSACHHDSLEALAPVIEDLALKYRDVLFLFFGYLPTRLASYSRVPGEMTARLIPRLKNVGFVAPVPLNQYHQALAQINADVALCPLVDVPFNRMKSPIKFLECGMYSAVIASDIPPFTGVIETGVDGLLVQSNQWYETIERLITDPALRSRLQANAREKIIRRHSWQEAPEAWNEALRAIGKSGEELS